MWRLFSLLRVAISAPADKTIVIDYYAQILRIVRTKMYDVFSSAIG